jgi:dipeptidyl aminopeptidase/acylaminoacyl peptidase
MWDWSKDLETEVIVPFLGGSFAEVPDVYKRASPINYVTKDAPSFLLYHGTEDKLVPVDQSIRFAEKLTSVGVPAQLVVLQGEGHGFTDATNQKSCNRCWISWASGRSNSRLVQRPLAVQTHSSYEL